MAGLNVPRAAHRFVAVDGVPVFHREAGPPDAPTMLLLHGFLSASHQFRRLIDALGGRYRLIAPDYPGFGHSDAPAAASVGGAFAYTFDRLADVIEGFCARLGLDRFVMYVFDFGAPGGVARPLFTRGRRDLRFGQLRGDWVHNRPEIP